MPCGKTAKTDVFESIETFYNRQHHQRMSQGAMAEAPLQRRRDEPEQPADFRGRQVNVRQATGKSRQQLTDPVGPVAEQGHPAQVEDGSEGDVGAQGQGATPTTSQRVMIFVITARVFSMVKLKVRKVGHSLGVVLPKEVINRLHTQDGQTLFLVETPDSGYRLTPYDPAFEQKMAKAEEIIDRYRNTLHVLAQ